MCQKILLPRLMCVYLPVQHMAPYVSYKAPMQLGLCKHANTKDSVMTCKCGVNNISTRWQ